MNFEQISDNNTFVGFLQEACESTYNAFVYDGIGGFCSLYRHPISPSNLFASSADGVGTKSLLAYQLRDYGYLSTIGIDLVAMVMNDIVTCGATPLFMLDYFATASIKGENHFTESQQILSGVVRGCRIAKCALIGGETAEMPQVYEKHQFDLAGFGVGLVHERNLLGSHRVVSGDAIIGLASSGPHSNGYTLIRNIFHDADWTNDDLRTSVMAPTEIYVSTVMDICKNFSEGCHAVAHITGGGLMENLKRVVPKSMMPNIDWTAWQRPDIFSEIKSKGGLSETQLTNFFNCGIGMVLVVDDRKADRILNRLSVLNVRSWKIGYLQ